MTEQQRNVEIVSQLNDYVNTRNYDAMPSLFVQDYVDHNPAWKIDGVAGLISIIQRFAEDIDMQNELKDIIAIDDKVYIHVQNNGFHKNMMYGVPPTQKPISMTTLEIYRFQDNKIAERWVVSDVLSVIKQLGATLPIQIA